MSYILEALRKADAERERGAVPDLQSQLLPGSPGDGEPAPRSAARWSWPVLGLAALAIGVVVWHFSGTVPVASPAAPALPAAAPAASATRMASAEPAAVATAASVPAGVGIATPASAPTTTAAPKADTRSKDDKPARKRREASAAKPAAAPAMKAETKASLRTAATPAPRPAPPAPPARVPRLNELPEDLRRQVPALAIGGSVYSPQADKRMVIVNGQVFQEGALLAAELKLEQVLPKAAVFSIRGERFEVPL